MGGSSSKSSIMGKQNRTTDLLQKIHNLIHDLSEEYSNKYMNPQFCNKVALIYRDKLKRFKKNEINGVSMSLGLVADVPQLKDRLCDGIIKHYTDRLNLVSAIRYSLSYCSNRIFALTSGPKCDSNPEVFSQEECVASGATWQNYVVSPDHTIEQNGQWYTYLNAMQDNYLSVLERLLEILTQLEKYDEDINEEKLKVMASEVERLIDSMKQQCQQLYKHALTTPTFTNQQLKAINEQQEITKQEAAARSAALRASQGTSPVPEMK